MRAARAVLGRAVRRGRGAAVKVIRSKVLGFCMGVRRAMDIVQAQCLASRRVFTLGPLIHNEGALKSLKEKGVDILEDDGSAARAIESAGCVVVIRAHGAVRGTAEALSARGLRVADATCPRVKASQKKASECAAAGRCVIIAGDRDHAEVKSVLSFAGSKARVIGSAEEARGVTPPARSVLVAQTTFGGEEFESIAKILKAKSPSLEVFNSICSETRERQSALRELAGRVQGVIVVGGKASSNTRRLFDAARGMFGMSCLAESASEIPKEFFALDAVGICSGASTPDEEVDAVERALLEGIAPG